MHNPGQARPSIIQSFEPHSVTSTSGKGNTTTKYISVPEDLLKIARTTRYIANYFIQESVHDEHIAKHLEKAIRMEAESNC